VWIYVRYFSKKINNLIDILATEQALVTGQCFCVSTITVTKNRFIISFA